MDPLVETLLVFAIAAVPIGITGLTFLDAAKRPGWVWALVGRSQVVWLAMIGFGVIALWIGVIVAVIYLIRVRPGLVAAENGDLGAG